jgi:hypothetical protein
VVEDGVTDGLGDAEGLGLVAPFGLVLYPSKLGVAKPFTGRFSTAAVMKSCQISAGIEPPNTLGKPSMLCIGTRPLL